MRPDSPLPDVRKKELRASLVWAMPSVLQVLAEVRRRAAAEPLKPSRVCRGFEEMAGESRQKTVCREYCVVLRSLLCECSGSRMLWQARRM